MMDDSLGGFFPLTGLYPHTGLEIPIPFALVGLDGDWCYSALAERLCLPAVIENDL
jgi:hypothetical protein